VAINHLINARILTSDRVHHPTGYLHHARQTGATARRKRDTARHKESDIAQVNELRRLGAETEHATRCHNGALKS
jgi:hypothetical protein